MNQTLTFDDLLQSDDEHNSNTLHLKQRCLQPGHYAEYLLKWLKYFPTKQVIDKFDIFVFVSNTYFSCRFISWMVKHFDMTRAQFLMIFRHHFFN